MSIYETVLNEDYSWPEAFGELPLKLEPSMVDRLDPEYVSFFNEILCNRPDILETHKFPVAKTKAGGNVIPGQAPAMEMAQVYDVTIPRKYTSAASSIDARVFVPKGEMPASGWPCTVWYHGGGWVLGNISTENSYCTHLAQLAQCVVITVDYRLAPEFPFPACVDDAFEALLYVLENPGILKIDNAKVCPAGSSAGGNLAAIMTHKYAASSLSKGLPPLKFQMMVVPVTDNTATADTRPSWKENERTPQLPATKMLWYRKIYLPEAGETLADPESSPLFYGDESFKKVPPAFIAAAECDVLRSEAEAYCEKLIENGINAKIKIYKGMPHTAMVMNERLEHGANLVKDTIESVKSAFYEA
ncbi:LADA_0G04962g1_1 [Lachancea dasiensis]|uniref:LADA_0G04962g1_1 n=1 Tax=Lachancea dasiensis TaxID=1072105 RepID=A0A1G4JSI1_9SACH|nr:LADA_0G04962g1_1 [Lachancea dasiensis]